MGHRPWFAGGVIAAVCVAWLRAVCAPLECVHADTMSEAMFDACYPHPLKNLGTGAAKTGVRHDAPGNRTVLLFMVENGHARDSVRKWQAIRARPGAARHTRPLLRSFVMDVVPDRVRRAVPHGFYYWVFEPGRTFRVIETLFVAERLSDRVRGALRNSTAGERAALLHWYDGYVYPQAERVLDVLAPWHLRDFHWHNVALVGGELVALDYDLAVKARDARAAATLRANDLRRLNRTTRDYIANYTDSP